MKRRIIKRIMTAVSLVTVIAVCVCMAVSRARGCFELFDGAALAAGMLSFSDGSPDRAPTQPAVSVSRPMAGPAGETSTSAERPTASAQSGEGLPIVETNISKGSMSYENIAVKNTTSYEPDVGALLSEDLPFALDDGHTVQVLIYHTHTCESYMTEDSSEYPADFYPRSTDPSQGVIAVGDKITAMLKSQGIGVVHDKTLHDYPSYEGSYSRSWDTIEKYAEKYPNIKVTIDIHRDSMTAADGTKYKPTFTYQGRKAAQIMIMTGCDTDGDFTFWDENLIFAAKLQKRCEDMYPGMTRPLYFGEFTYNMDFNNGSLLIEVGTDANTVEEACLSGELLGNALSSVLQKG